MSMFDLTSTQCHVDGDGDMQHRKSDNLIGGSEMNVLHGMLRTRAANNKNCIGHVGFHSTTSMPKSKAGIFHCRLCHLCFAVSQVQEEVDMGLLDDEETEGGQPAASPIRPGQLPCCCSSSNCSRL